MGRLFTERVSPCRGAVGGMMLVGAWAAIKELRRANRLKGIAWAAVLSSCLYSGLAVTAEEKFSLDDIGTPSVESAPQKLTLPSRQWKWMGRLDFNYEYYPRGVPGKNNTYSQFTNNHFFFFVKAQPNPNLQVEAEVIGQTYYEIEIPWQTHHRFRFGKILVPFGLPNSFHRYYGGVQGYSGQGVFLPNVWAQKGMDYSFQGDDNYLDFYLVEGFTAVEGALPNIRSAISDGSQMALGGRWQRSWWRNGFQTQASFYSQNWQDSLPLVLVGLDLQVPYGFLASSLRFQAGWAVAEIALPAGEVSRRQGDYIEIASPLAGGIEGRLRYGTYIHDQRTPSVNDLHNWNLGLKRSWQELSVLAEYQWNMEALNEVDNDLFRLLLAVDF